MKTGNTTSSGPGGRTEAARPQQAGAASQTHEPGPLPAVSLPKGGGAIRGMGEKFTSNPITGTGSMSVPIATSPGRAGFGPQLSLSYDSGAGNGPFGFGWSLSAPAIVRKTDKGLPQYRDAEESDVFILSGAEDLVPVLLQDNAGECLRDAHGNAMFDEAERGGYTIRRYRPRVEGLFARIERWTRVGDPEDIHWRSVSKDNILTLYGKDANSRIAHPEYPGRIFSWLIGETRDDKGNVIVYRYKAEDGKRVDLGRAHERNRGSRDDVTRTANRYLKRICYGNRVPLLDNKGKRPSFLTQDQLDTAEWMFEVVFDYGEHDAANPRPGDSGDWPCRQDPFSTYRPGFEVRTCRLCRRVLMFHHFPEEPGVGRDCLVRSTSFDFRETPVASFVTAATQSGYKRTGTGYLRQSLPPLEFEYSQAVVGQAVRDLDPESMENLPYGVDGAAYQWVDLDGEGLSGVLSQQGGGWFYKRNKSALARDEETKAYVARLAPMEVLPRIPAGASPSGGRWEFLDLAGDGKLDLVALDGPVSGFYERSGDEDWETFRSIRSIPNLAWNDPNLKFIDLTGDGHADVLITEDEALTWYPSLAEDGFGAASRVGVPTDEEHGPRVVFADSAQTIFLADLSGDGLTDIVRIRNGEVSYWPNLGYGRFGAKVTMDDAPWFDMPDQFDPRRIRLADIDGSGVTDIIYPGRNGARFWFNQSGNAWSQANDLPGFPPVDNAAAVAAVDLLGNGTACLVWSSPLPGNARAPIKYLNLMAEGKPHLLTRTRNNMGAETHIRYEPSTHFYLRDKYAGRPWITKLPFPVHAVERVETYDFISRNYFVTRYAYHHGYFDGEEREFRGFGMVEQRDTEAFGAVGGGEIFPMGDNTDPVSHVPPVLTKTWFHTGVFVDRDHISDLFAGMGKGDGEYYREPELRGDDARDPAARALLLPDTVLPPDLTPSEQREACRALKGSMLRQEVYALDGTPKADHPYTVAEQNFTVKRLQARGDNRHAVFFTHAREAIQYHYERNPADPRVAHALTIEVDKYGNAVKELSIGYGRRPGHSPLQGGDTGKQEQTLITYTENDVTKPIDDSALYPDDYRAPLPCETRTYEVTGLTADGDAGRFRFEAFAGNGFDLLLSLPEIEYETPVDYDKKRKRLIESVRTLYRKDDLSDLLGKGELEPMALPGEDYKLAFTPGLLDRVYRRDGQKLLPVAPADVLAGGGPDRGGYVDLDGNGCWWIPTGRIFLSPGAGDTPAEELAYARRHFFLPHRYRDPFGATATVTYDRPQNAAAAPYDLLLQETVSPLGNRVTVGERPPAGERNPAIPGNDYRVLQPFRIMDPNRNRTEVAFDALGMVVGMAVMGKPEEKLGDSLDGFVADLAEDAVLAHLADPLADPHAILGRATTRLVYDLFAFRRTHDQPGPQPAVVYTLARETHDADLKPGEQTKVQHNFSYSDGFGREIQKKLQAEPEKAGGVAGPPRWVGSGWTVFNNKGKPVRRYEPFFTATHRFEFDAKAGVSPILFYDPVERVAATLHPNDTYEKVVFDPWQQATWDVNDTVLGNPRDDDDVKGFTEAYFAALTPPPGGWRTWHAQRQGGAMGAREQAAATKAAAHADTPTVVHFDALGRPFLTLAHNGFNPDNTPILYPTRVFLDIEGNQREVRDAVEQDGDARGRIVMRYDYDMLGNRIRQSSMEAGERWMLNDAAGKPIRAWDSRDHVFRTEYDALRRPLRSFVTGADPADPGRELLTERLVYGEQHPESELHNLRGKPYLHLDQAGAVTNEAHDFKGNLRHASRRIAKQYKKAVDWSAVDAVLPAEAILDPAALEAALDPPLEVDTFASLTAYDALNRTAMLTTPDHSAVRPGYNEANLLDRLDVNLRGATAGDQPVWTPFVTNIDYDAKGQRQRIDYGNGVTTLYEYDPLTFRLTHLLTARNPVAFPGDSVDPPPAGWPGRHAQNLHYTYDPAGNITYIRDDAQQTVYFRNIRVEPSADHTYDALYQLIESTGREHLGQAEASAYNDAAHVKLPHPGDGNAMGTYIEHYVYDAVGNFLEMRHQSSDPAHHWTRGYAYGESSLIEDGAGGAPLKTSNRVSATTVGAATETYSTGGNGYDPHGNMLRMPQLQTMQWDYKDQLRMTQRQRVNDKDEEGIARNGERTYYVYDTAGQRVRKITELANGDLKDERIYLGTFEIYRKHTGTDAGLVRETLHVMDDKQRIALVETRNDIDDSSPKQCIRYQFGNHLGSVCLELDEDAHTISYEEYTPYGSTSYQAVRQDLQVSAKRYRYTGKERDEESGLYYHGARYYAPWLGRWTSSDSLVENHHLASSYNGMMNSPTTKVDLDGRDALIVAFPDYKVDTEIPTTKLGPLAFERKQPLGHGGVILIDNKTGMTKYYEYGRYPTTDGTKGRVRGPGSPDYRPVPNVVIGKDGKPTPDSLKVLLDKVSLRSGQGGKIEAAYVKSDKFKQMDDYAQKKLKESNPGNPEYNKDRKPYELLNNNCGTFAADVVNQDPTVAQPFVILNPTPSNIVDEYQEEGHTRIQHPAPSTPAQQKTAPSQTPGKPKHEQRLQHKRGKSTEYSPPEPVLHMQNHERRAA